MKTMPETKGACKRLVVESCGMMAIFGYVEDGAQPPPSLPIGGGVVLMRAFPRYYLYKPLVSPEVLGGKLDPRQQ